MFRNHSDSKRKLRDLSGDESGTPAIEFAMVSPIFFLMVFALLELGWLFIRMSLLDSAVAVVGREVYTGAAAYGFVSQDDIEESICNRLVFTNGSSCTQNLTVELTVINDFNDAPNDAAICRDDTMNVQPVTEYEPGSDSEIIYMRVCLTTPLMLPAIGIASRLPQTSDGRFRLTSAITFMNEPFGSVPVPAGS